MTAGVRNIKKKRRKNKIHKRFKSERFLSGRGDFNVKRHISRKCARHFVLPWKKKKKIVHSLTCSVFLPSCENYGNELHILEVFQFRGSVSYEYVQCTFWWYFPSSSEPYYLETDFVRMTPSNVLWTIFWHPTNHGAWMATYKFQLPSPKKSQRSLCLPLKNSLCGIPLFLFFVIV